MNFKLTPQDRHNPLWIRLIEFATEQRAVLRAKNDAPLDAVATAELRGKIGMYSALIALDMPEPELG